MPDTDPYQDSGLTEKLLDEVKTNSDDAASLQKPKTKPAAAAAKPNPKPKPAAQSTTPTPDTATNVPTVGADAPASGADTIMGGNTAISTSSMKGSALANDPSSNLARKSEYRNVFHKRGAEGKHNWGGK